MASWLSIVGCGKFLWLGLSSPTCPGQTIPPKNHYRCAYTVSSPSFSRTRSSIGGPCSSPRCSSPPGGTSYPPRATTFPPPPPPTTSSPSASSAAALLRLHHKNKSNNPAAATTPNVIPTVNPTVKFLPPLLPSSTAGASPPPGPGGSPGIVGAVAVVVATLMLGTPPAYVASDVDTWMMVCSLPAASVNALLGGSHAQRPASKSDLQQKVAEGWPARLKGVQAMRSPVWVSSSAWGLGGSGRGKGVGTEAEAPAGAVVPFRVGAGGALDGAVG